MNKNLSIGLGVAAVVVLGVLGYAYRRQIKGLFIPAVTPPVASPSPSQTMPVPGSTATEKEVIVEVSYTDSGFSPKTVTVKTGTTVKWTNTSSISMWVASDPHPTHGNLPGFDQLSAGPTYSYTFTKVGTWGYHNHLKTSDRGTVVVTQ